MKKFTEELQQIYDKTRYESSAKIDLPVAAFRAVPSVSLDQRNNKNDRIFQINTMEEHGNLNKQSEQENNSPYISPQN